MARIEGVPPRCAGLLARLVRSPLHNSAALGRLGDVAPPRNTVEYLRLPGRTL